MSGKILVLNLWPKMLSANQIARFFKFEYLQNLFTVFDDFFIIKEYNDGVDDDLPMSMPELSQALPKWPKTDFSDSCSNLNH